MPEFSTPTSRPRSATEDMIGRHQTQNVQASLAAADSVGDLLCDHCPTARLCGAAVLTFSKLVRTKDHGRLADSARAFGIELSGVDATICPRALVQAAQTRTQEADFWVATDDPLFAAPTEFKDVDTIITAARDVAAALQDGRIL